MSIYQVLEAGKLLHIKEHTVLDGAEKIVTLCAPVECKGIVGSDDRYVVATYDFKIHSHFAPHGDYCYFYCYVDKLK